MKAYAKFTPYFIIIILLVIIVFLRECNKPKPCPEPTTTTETIIKHDTVRIKGEDHYYPVYTEVYDTIIKHLSKEDSARIIADYIIGRNYNLLIVDDTNATINFYATVQFNKIAKWNYEGKYYPKTITTTITNTIPEVKRAKVFLGFDIGYNIGQNSVFLAPVATLCTKSDHLYQIGYEPLSRTAYFGMAWKIRIKK